MSLRRRVLIGFLVVAAVLVVTNVVLATTFHSFLQRRVDRQLTDVAARPFFRSRGPGGPGPDRAELDRAGSLSEYFIAEGYLDDATLARISSAIAAADQPQPQLRQAVIARHLTDREAEARPFTVPAEGGGGSWRMVAVTSGPDARVTVVGISLDELDATLARIRLVQVAGTLAVLLSLAVVSWWMVRLGVHPLEDMAQVADAIAEGDLSRRVDHPGGRTEAGRLGLALNAMLGRIEESFRAQEASETKVRRFAADASHELRTPLTSIQGYAELWRAGGLRNEGELAEGMRRMEQEAKRMGGLVEDLLLLARLDQRRPLERTEVRLDEIVGDAVRDARAVQPDRPVEVAAAAVAVAGDEMRLRQIAANLVANAITHTPPGTAVRVSVAVEGTTARLEVADAGPGMPPEVAERVFERFYRADPSRARAGGGTGTGLGLSIVAAIAEAHGGRATVHSAVGQGSRFVVELPGARTGPPTTP